MLFRSASLWRLRTRRSRSTSIPCQDRTTSTPSSSCLIGSPPSQKDTISSFANRSWGALSSSLGERRAPLTSPASRSIDVPAIFIGVAAPEFVRHLDASRTALLAAASQTANAANDADLLDLYRGVIELQKMHNAFCPEYVSIASRD